MQICAVKLTNLYLQHAFSGPFHAQNALAAARTVGELPAPSVQSHEPHTRLSAFLSGRQGLIIIIIIKDIYIVPFRHAPKVLSLPATISGYACGRNRSLW